MVRCRPPSSTRVGARWAVALLIGAGTTACGAPSASSGLLSGGPLAAHAGTTVPTTATTRPAPATSRPPSRRVGAAVALSPPPPLRPFTSKGGKAQGVWRPAGRPVDGTAAVFETTLVPPGGAQPAGVAWMDTRLLSVRLYSGSVSPGGGPYRYTAPIEPAQAATLVAVFNGGFKMHDANGGYYTEGRMVYPLRAGAASLVIYRDGSVKLGAWGRDVSMTASVVAVRQNLIPLVAGGRPTAAAESTDWQAWGNTCGLTSCASSVPGVDHQLRSGLGISADGALVYAYGPALDPLQLAELLVRAGAVRGMELDINPYWPVFVTYRPPGSKGLAAPANGHSLLSGGVQGPATFFDPAWARDFVTMSARPAPAVSARGPAPLGRVAAAG
ncbi:MAG: hypothetical protein ACYCUG_04065 [Acidimicrobiales bacterium]